MKKFLCLLAILFASPAAAGIVSVNVTESTQFVDLATIDLTAYDDFALWGAYPSGSLMTAQYSGTGSLINRNMSDLTTGNPVRSMGQFAWHEPGYKVSASTTTNAGVQHYPLPYSPIYEGFRMQVLPSATDDTVYTVYGTSWGGTTRIMAFGAEYDPVTVYTGQDVRFRADFTVAAGGGPLLLQFQLATQMGGDRNSDSNVTISAVGADLVAVPEPVTIALLAAAAPLLYAWKKRSNHGSCRA